MANPYYDPRASYFAGRDYYDQFGIDRRDKRDLLRQGYERSDVRRMVREVPNKPWDGRQFFNTDLGRQAEMQNPGGALTRYGAKLGYTGESAFDRWFRSQQPRMMEGLAAAQTKNPFLRPTEYFNQLGPGGGGGNFNGRRARSYWQNRYAALTPDQRGEDPSAYGTNRQQWV